MKVQVKAANGQSFWDLTNISWEALACGEPDCSGDPWVIWQGHTWLCKRKDESICEVVGYQIAEALGIPVQPWVAFFQNGKTNKLAANSGVGILVKKWQQAYWDAPLCELAKTHSDLVCRALTVEILNRMEGPKWLMSEDKNNLRLFDLEYIGPALHWPPQKTPLNDYQKHTKHALADTREMAREAGVLKTFEKHFQSLTALDFSRILDFTGHAHADVMEKVIVRGLEVRQRELVRLVSRWESTNLPT